MLHPSYAELMERINKDVEEGATPVVQSRYSIVKATANRAKQIIEARALEEKVSFFQQAPEIRADRKPL